MAFTTKRLYGKDKLPELAAMDFVGSCRHRIALLSVQVSKEMDRPMLDRDMEIVTARMNAADFWNDRIAEVEVLGPECDRCNDTGCGLCLEK